LVLISVLRYGLSEKPPTINTKSTGESFALAAFNNSCTLSSIYRNKGWKKLFIKPGGKSILLAPLGITY